MSQLKKSRLPFYEKVVEIDSENSIHTYENK